MNKVAYKSGLFSFIKLLDESDKLIRVKEKVSTDQEIAEFSDRIMKSDCGGKAILFEDTGTDFPLLINSMGSSDRINKVFGKNLPEAVFTDMFDLAKTLSGSGKSFKMISKLWNERSLLKVFPKTVKSKAICQQNVLKEPDISKLPVLKSWPFDGGAFFTLPLVFTKHPQTESRNIGMYRMQVFDKQTTGMHWHRHKGGAEHYAEYKKAGLKMPVAVALGGDPLLTYLATAPLPEGIDELLMYGLIRRRSAKMVRCITQDIEVPADADIVLEGYIDPEEDLRTEGPFGDHTGFYSLEDKYPAFHITAITHKDNAVYPATIVGIPPMEDLYLGEATERLFKPAIKAAIAPELLDFHLPAEGVAHNLVLLKVRNRFPGAVQKTMHALLGAGQMMFSKVLISLPETMDLTNYDAVLNHLVNEIHPDKLVISSGPADELEHASPDPVFGGKLMIDISSEKNHSKAELKIGEDFIKYGRIFITTNKDLPLPEDANCYIVTDFPVDKTVLNYQVWWILSNLDPRRDIKREGDLIKIDASVKSGQNNKRNRWPSPVLSSDDTIKIIDHKWNKLTDIEFIESPSLKMKKFLKSEGAEIKNI